jgi:hypothetical protein
MAESSVNMNGTQINFHPDQSRSKTNFSSNNNADAQA